MAIFSKLFDFVSGRGKARTARTNQRLDRVAAERRGLEEKRRLDKALAQQRVDSRLGKIAGERRTLEEQRRLGEALKKEQERRRKEEERRAREPLYRFIFQGEWLATPQSSNVRAVHYSLTPHTLEIEFKDGSMYRYFEVPVPYAESLFRAASKGKWVWDNLRIRGTKLGHRFEYAMILGPKIRKRRWEATPQRARRHSEKVAAQSGAKSVFEKVGKFQRAKPKDQTRT